MLKRRRSYVNPKLGSKIKIPEDAPTFQQRLFYMMD